MQPHEQSHQCGFFFKKKILVISKSMQKYILEMQGGETEKRNGFIEMKADEKYRCKRTAG